MLKSKDIFEEFRGLSNLEIPGRKLISIVLFGLPDLETNMMVDPPLVQRIAVKVGIRPLDAAGTAAYVRHRLAVAGGKPDIFDDAALAEVHKVAKGVPRVINTICDNALLESFLVKKDKVGAAMIGDVAKDLGILGMAS
jgi:type II secretory pathway predicted ATPase ExeA